MTTANPALHGFRVLLGVSGALYLAWWFAVELLLPGSYNPIGGRLVVVAYFFTAFALTFTSAGMVARAAPLFYVGALATVAHYFYLFSHNAADLNWTVGAYVVVFALCVSVQSRAWLYALTSFAFVCGALVWWRAPLLQKTIFLPGLFTILVLCLVVLLSRIRLLESWTESTLRLQSLFDAAFEGIAVQESGHIIDVNASFVALFGYSRDELVGSSVIALNAPDYRERVAAQIREVPSGRYESVGLHKSGATFPIEVSSKPHAYRGRIWRLAAVRDLSDRQRADREREQLLQEQAARAAALEAVRLRDEFIAIASHELRTPIASLLLNLDVLARKPDIASDGKELPTYVARMQRQLGRMSRLVEELLDVSRLDGEPLRLTREEVELQAVVQDAIDSLAEDLRRADCAIRVDCPAPVTGQWDRLRLEQVIANLVRNALIYGAGRPIELTLARDDGGHALLTVRDHGIGIDPALHERVFDRFVRGVSPRHYGGLGLGLYIAQQIAHAHGGRLYVESAPGAGSTFHLVLPIAPEAPRA